MGGMFSKPKTPPPDPKARAEEQRIRDVRIDEEQETLRRSSLLRRGAAGRGSLFSNGAEGFGGRDTLGG
jgi:hypothetical protein